MAFQNGSHNRHNEERFTSLQVAEFDIYEQRVKVTVPGSEVSADYPHFAVNYVCVHDFVQ